MKVSVIGTRGFPKIEGGVEKHCEILYPLLKEDIYIDVYRRKPYVTENGSYERISFRDLPSTKIKGFETFFHSLLATVDALIRKPDVVHYHNIGPAFFCPILKVRKIPVVMTYHSPNYEHKKWGRFARNLLLLSEKVALRSADKIVFVNKFQMEKYAGDIRSKSVYVPNGIIEPMFSGNTYFLDKLGIERNKYILSVGRITQEKGFDTLIKAFAKIKNSGFKLVIAGGVEFESDYMRKLKELSEGLDVVFAGYVYGDELAQLYTNAALYVLSSNNEGFPLVLLEAMSYGLDVLVSDIPATHLVDLDKSDYFEKGNYEELGNRMSEKIQNVHRRKYDLEKYNWKEIANTMSTLFHEVVGG